MPRLIDSLPVVRDCKVNYAVPVGFADEKRCKDHVAIVSGATRDHRRVVGGILSCWITRRANPDNLIPAIRATELAMSC